MKPAWLCVNKAFREEIMSLLDFKKMLSNGTNIKFVLEQGSPNYGPWAGSGTPQHFAQPQNYDRRG